jgi:hypothetical protein
MSMSSGVTTPDERQRFEASADLLDEAGLGSGQRPATSDGKLRDSPPVTTQHPSAD